MEKDDAFKYGRNVYFCVDRFIQDGNSLFRALAWLQLGDEDAHSRIRKRIVDHVVERWEAYKVYATTKYGLIFCTADQYSNYMISFGVNGDLAEISAATEIFKITFFVHMPGQNRMIKIGHEGEVHMLLYTRGKHGEIHIDLLKRIEYLPEDFYE